MDYDYIKMALNSPDIPNTPEEKVNTLLKYVNNCSSYYGEFVSIFPKVIFSNNEAELISLVKELEEQCLVKQRIRRQPVETERGLVNKPFYDVSITL